MVTLYIPCSYNLDKHASDPLAAKPRAKHEAREKGEKQQVCCAAELHYNFLVTSAAQNI